MTEKIEASMIIEMMGKPAEHLISTMKQLLEQMNKESGVGVKEYKIAEPKKIEGEEMFSLFSDVRIEVNSINSLFPIMFSYMPSHIEIINPMIMQIKNSELNAIANELQRRLHKYDEIAKRVYFENSILRRQLEQLGVKPAVGEMVQRAKKEDDKGEIEKTKKKKGKKKKS